MIPQQAPLPHQKHLQQEALCQHLLWPQQEALRQHLLWLQQEALRQHLLWLQQNSIRQLLLWLQQEALQNVKMAGSFRNTLDSVTNMTPQRETGQKRLSHADHPIHPQPLHLFMTKRQMTF